MLSRSTSHSVHIVAKNSSQSLMSLKCNNKVDPLCVTVSGAPETLGRSTTKSSSSILSTFFLVGDAAFAFAFGALLTFFKTFFLA